ncbi:hypothetical protein [Shinella sumterensis]|uniref:Helix-turn-helix domain-containing protein n=1 Tax=Shinella sumterensis TaxID=1967501 RepID=A0AA50H6N7_9HYPH|nr:hypothetical protein [Shinella sumterensis]WLR98658.1 hypothetical protein Q9313_06400 [Shinella sumterensis]
MSEEKLDQIYTADEAAARLRLTNRALIKIAKKHGCCSRFGRDYLFSEADLFAIWEVLREPEREPRPRTTKAPSAPSPFEAVAWMFGPSVPVDIREMEVLRAVAKRRSPCTHKAIPRAGPRTVERLVGMEALREVGRDDEDETLFVIADEGRKIIAKVDTWIQKCVANGKTGGRWARHLVKRP